MTLGERIRVHRKRMNLTQEELAKKLNTSPQNIYKYEKGIIQNIPLDKIDALARLFGISPSTLAGWSENTADPQRTPIRPHMELTPIETLIITSYRQKPETHAAILRILDLDAGPSDSFYMPESGLKLASPKPTLEEIEKMHREKMAAEAKKK